LGILSRGILAGGVDLEKHVLGKMEFKPIIDKYEEMDRELFREEPLNIISWIKSEIRR
jgi:acyl CoA:acetate/3-ketoacid CoA transferase